MLKMFLKMFYVLTAITKTVSAIISLVKKCLNGTLKYIYFFYIYSDIQHSLSKLISRVFSTSKFRAINVIMHIYKNYVIFFHQVDLTLLPSASVVVGAEVSNLTQLTNKT